MKKCNKFLFLFLLTLTFVCFVNAEIHAISAVSPWNLLRPKRSVTAFIILHTTEGPLRGSLDKLRRNGEAHYLIDEKGNIYRIIDHYRIATHCGRSVWNGVYDLDQYSIGIELVGCYNKEITKAQYAALSSLIKELKRIYYVPDTKILPHSMVAYGSPNRWYRKPHRGRKRCGALFALSHVRQKIGIGAAPEYDPDVQAGRLINADQWLADFLYGKRNSVVLRKSGDSTQGTSPVLSQSGVISSGRSAWDIAKDAYNSPSTIYILPDGSRKKGSEITNWKTIPAGTKVIIGDVVDGNERDSLRKVGSNGESAFEIAGEYAANETTYYFFPDGRIRSGNELTKKELLLLPSGTYVLVGYISGGIISAKNSAFEVCGNRWNLPSTLYRFPDGSFKWGDEVDEKKISKGTRVFYCK